jgi:hypothetical protein
MPSSVSKAGVGVAKSLSGLGMQRLAYVRYLYQEGIEHSQRPTPLSSSALLSFHDAVENFLGLAAEHLGVEVRPGISFMEYWGAFKPEFDLPSKASMKRLNETRVNLKHHGVFPSAQGIEQARECVVDFFTTVTPMIFNVSFDQIDMAGLVTQEETARLLQEAETHAAVHDYTHAMAGLSLAFEALLKQYAGRGDSWDWRESPFSFGPTLHHRDRAKDPRLGIDPIIGGINKLMDVAEETQTALRLISLGIDFPQYTRFAALAPRVHGYFSGPPRYVVPPSLAELGAEDYAWARQFVIESALRAASADGILQLLDEHAKKDWDPKGKPAPQRSWTGAFRQQEESGDEEEGTIEA